MPHGLDHLTLLRPLRTAGRHDFDQMVALFRCALQGGAAGGLRGAGWFDRARAWRLAFLADETGAISPSHGLAVALQAVVGVLPGAAFDGAAGALPEDSAPAAGGASPSPRRLRESVSKLKGEDALPVPAAAAASAKRLALAELRYACPLSDPSEAALLESVPDELYSLLAAESEGEFDAPRVWCTLLARAFLARPGRTGDVRVEAPRPSPAAALAYLLSPGAGAATGWGRRSGGGVSLADAADGWLASAAAAAPPLRDALPSLRRLAEAQVAAWEARHRAVVRQLSVADEGRSSILGDRGARRRAASASALARALRSGCEGAAVLFEAA